MISVNRFRTVSKGLLIIVATSILTACASQQLSESDLTRISPSVQDDLAKATETLNPTESEIYAATAIPLFSPTLAPINVTTISPTATETQPTPIPVATLMPFTFQGTVVLSIAPDIEVQESALWQWSTERQELQPLLEKEGVLFGQPLLSSTGHYLAYTQLIGNLASIWVMDMATAETKKWSEDFQINSMELQDYPHYLNWIVIQSWTPDETALIFQYWEEQVASDEPIWSYLLFEDGRSEQLDSRIVDVSWSVKEPNRLVYLSQYQGVYLVDINQIDSSTQLIADINVSHGSLAWHPDSQHIAIVGNLRDKSLLWNLDLNTSQLTEIENGEPADHFIRWSPDGQSLLWVANDKVMTLGFKDNSFTELMSFQLP
ncbi:MAG: PD40 domain-containing protein, partial [Ardenticatenaceae bacterium]|nr:PD40 domain-containing protein [Ardenticatenaceae bacterium]